MNVYPSGVTPAPPEDDPSAYSPYSRRGTPAPLAAAAGLVFIEGVLTVIFGLTELVTTNLSRITMGATTALFFLAYGVALLVCAWGLNGVRHWARGPILFAQLVWLGLAWNFRGGDTTWVSIILAVTAFLVLAGLLHPNSMKALEDAEFDR